MKSWKSFEVFEKNEPISIMVAGPITKTKLKGCITCAMIFSKCMLRLIDKKTWSTSYPSLKRWRSTLRRISNPSEMFKPVHIYVLSKTLALKRRRMDCMHFLANFSTTLWLCYAFIHTKMYISLEHFPKKQNNNLL